MYSDNPFLALVKKKTDMVGKYYPVPVITGVSQGRSSTFATAQANQTSAIVNEFLVTRAKDYSIAQIDNETMLASATDKGAFLRGSKLMIDAAFQTIDLSLASALFRSGTGTIGVISAISTGVITLTNAGDIVQFELNQTLQVAATDGGTPRGTLGYVINVNRSEGKLTVAASGLGGVAATPTNWVANDFILVQGDSNLKIKGLSAWLVAANTVASTPFFGVDRSVDKNRLAGIYYDGSSQSIEEAFLDASGFVAREGGKTKLIVTNFASFTALEKSLGSKVQYVDSKGPANIGFRGIKLNGANTTMDVFPDRSCQALTAYMLTPENWELGSLGDAPQILRYGDNLDMLRVYTADAGEVRIGYYAQLYTNAPGRNANVLLGA